MDDVRMMRGRVRRGPWNGGPDLNSVFQQADAISTVPGGVADDLYLTPQQSALVSRGVYNGDFAEGPPDPSSPIDNITNKLPGWELVTVQGTSITAYWVADSIYPGGAYIRFDVAAGNINDEVYFQQDVPVHASFFGRAAIWVQGSRLSKTGIGGSERMKAQFLRLDQATTTGAEGSGTGSLMQAIPNSTGKIPNDATFLRLKVGAYRPATSSDTGVVPVSDIRLVKGDYAVIVADTGSSYSGSITQSNGTLSIKADDGVEAYIDVDDLDADVIAYPRITVPLVASTPAIPGYGAGMFGSFFADSSGTPKFTYSLDGVAQTTVTLGLAAGAITFSGCRVYRTADFSVGTGSDTDMLWATGGSAVEAYDTDAFHAGAGNTERYVAPFDGYYHIDAGVVWEANSSGARQLWLETNAGVILARDRELAPSASIAATNQCSADVYLVAGEWVKAVVRQTSGGNLNVLAAGEQTFFNIHRLGGLTGATGATGAAGADGADGADGVGVPAGGTTGQVLAKASAADYDTEWVAAGGGGDHGALTGLGDDDHTQYIHKTPSAAQAIVSPSGGGSIPLTITADAAQTADLFVVEDSSGNDYLNVSSAGRFEVSASGEVLTTNFTAYRSAVSGAIIALRHSRTTTVGSQTILNSGDYLGRFRFMGSDGTNFIDGAYFDVRADSAPSTGVMPGRVSISTSPAASSTPAERIRIDSAGLVTFYYDQTTEGYIEQKEQSAPATPASGYGRYYVSTAGRPRFINDAGTDQVLASQAFPNILYSRNMGFAHSNLTSTKTITSGSSFAVYVGRAPRDYTGTENIGTIRNRVTTAAATITWAEVAIAKGSLNLGGNPTLTVVGWASVSGTFNSLGQKSTTVALTSGQSIAEGDGLWVIIGNQATTACVVRALSMADDLQVGVQASVASRPSTTLLGTPTAFTIEGATTLPAWVALVMA